MGSKATSSTLRPGSVLRYWRDWVGVRGPSMARERGAMRENESANMAPMKGNVKRERAAKEPSRSGHGRAPRRFARSSGSGLFERKPLKRLKRGFVDKHTFLKEGVNERK